MKKANYIKIAGLALFVWGCKKEYVSSDIQLTSNLKPVRVVSLQEIQTTNPITASGVLASKEETVLSFKVGGVIQNLNVNEGEQVHTNQKLANLNLSEINAQVESAKYTYEKSIRDFERANNLYKDTVGTLEQVQNTKTVKEISKSNLATAQFNRQFSIINSPFKGSVLKKYVEEGEIVSAGQPVYKIGTTGFTGAQILQVGIADKDVIKINIKDSASIVFDALPNKKIPAYVTEISSTAHPSTGLYNVELTLKKYHNNLKNGFVGKAQLYPSSDSKKYRIPIDALVEGKGEMGRIFITINNKTVEEKRVEVLNFGSDFMIVDTLNLAKTSSVVIEGAAYLKSNDSIQILK
jgi:RND family efflux transporter MFP subunit